MILMKPLRCDRKPPEIKMLEIPPLFALYLICDPIGFCSSFLKKRPEEEVSVVTLSIIVISVLCLCLCSALDPIKLVQLSNLSQKYSLLEKHV